MAKNKARHNVALEVVCNIGRAIAAEMDLAALLELIYQESGRVMDTDCFAMALYDPIADGLRFELLYDRGERLAEMLLTRAEGWGLAGRVFEEGTPLLFSDLQQDGLPEEAIALGDVPRSWLGVPLIAHDRTIGTMSVQNYQPGAFGPADQDLLEAIASQAAVAIENLFLRREQDRRIAELSALSEIGQAIITTTDLEELLEVIYQQTSRVMDTSNLYVALYHPEEELISFDFFMEDGKRTRPASFHVSDGGTTAHIITSREPILIGLIGESAAQEMEALGIDLVGRPAESYLGVPMLAGDRVVGVLSIQHPEKRRAFDRRHLDLLANIANLAAVAIDNIRLSQDREQRLTELAILNEIGRAVSSSLDLNELVSTIHQQVSRIFDTTNFYIATYEEESDEWTMALQVEHGEAQPPLRRKVAAGLTGSIIRSGQPLLLRCLEENLAFHDDQGIAPIGERALSWLGVPLQAAGKILGVMAIQSYEQEYLYDQQDLALFSTIAAQAAVALGNARLLQQLQEQITDLSVLNQVAQAMLVTESEEELLESIYEQAGRVIDTTDSYIALYDERTQAIDFALYVEKGQRVPGPGRRPLAEGGLTVYLIQERNPVLLTHDIEGQLRQLGISPRGRPAQSYLGVPMIAGEQVIGAIAVQSTEREHAFTPRHLDLLMNIATQAALAVQRTRLRASEARKAQQLAIIGQASRKLTAILDLDELLHELAHSIQTGFGFSNVAVYRVDEEPQEMVLGALIGRYAGMMKWGFRQSISEGMIGWAVREGKTRVAGDVLQDPFYIRGLDEEGLTCSEMCVPISYGGRVIGVLDIQAEEVQAFDEEDVAAMETLAGQLASAMRNAILFRERGAQLASTNALNRIIQATTAALSLEDLLTSLCDVVVDLMSPDGFFVALRDADSGNLVAHLLMDEGIFYEDQVLSPGKGFTDHMMRTGQPVLIRSMDQEAANYPVERSVMGSGRHAASWLGVPLRTGEEPIGGIVVQSYRPYAFDEQDMQFLQSVANSIVVNIDRARLFEETQRALGEVREANEQQRRLLSMVQELSTPLVPITEEILVLPLVGTIDSQRAQQILDVLLEGISGRRARVVILDITGVPVVDTSVANHLLQATQAVRLLGAECVLVGITPEVAQTVVGLGVDLRGLTTRSDLQGGVEYALQLRGQKILKPKKRRPEKMGPEKMGPGKMGPEKMGTSSTPTARTPGSTPPAP